MPILLDFIKLMNKSISYNFLFHATEENKNLISEHVSKKITLKI